MLVWVKLILIREIFPGGSPVARPYECYSPSRDYVSITRINDKGAVIPALTVRSRRIVIRIRHGEVIWYARDLIPRRAAISGNEKPSQATEFEVASKSK